jgi:hypothetical protein
VPNLIDSLVVSLGLDSSGFTAGQKKVIEDLRNVEAASARSAKTMQSEGAKAAEYFTSIRNEALSLLGVLVGFKGIEALVKDTTSALATLGKQALRIGEDPSAIEAYTQAIYRMGGNADAARDSLVKFRTAQFEWQTQKDNPEWVRAMGIIGASPNDSPLAFIQDFMKFIERMKSVPGGRNQADVQGVAAGLDLDTIASLWRIGTPGNYQRQIARSQELGVPTPAQIDALTKLQTAFRELETAANTLGRQMVANNSGWMTDLLTWMTKETQLNPGVVTGLGELTAALSALVAVRMGAAALGLKGLASAIDGLFVVLTRIMPLLLPLILRGDTPADDAEGKKNADTQRAATKGWMEKWNALKPRWWPSWLPWEGGPSPSAVAPTGMEGTPPNPFFDIATWMNKSFTSGDAAIGGTSDTSLSSDKRALLDAIAGGESTGPDPYHQPNVAGGSAYGRYQFQPQTWREISAITGLGDINNPSHQDQNAWALASQEYRRYTFGRDLESDIHSGGHAADIAAALRGRWPSLPGGSQPNPATSGFTGRLQNRRDPNLIPPTGGPRVAPANNNSSLDVGTVNIHTQATDAPAIARDFHQALADRIVFNADTGLV